MIVEYKEFVEALNNSVVNAIDYDRGTVNRKAKEMEIIEEYLEDYFSAIDDKILIGYILGLHKMHETMKYKVR